MLADDVGDAAAERRLVGVLPVLGEPEQHIHRIVGPVLAHREQQLQQPVLQRRTDARHHAEIDQRDPAVDQEHVAGMRIGVEEAVAQHHAQIGAQQRIGEPLAFDVEARRRAERGDLGAGDELHGEQARGAERQHRLRHHDLLDVLQVGGESDEVQRFLAEVQLAQHRAAELVEQRAHREPLAHRRVLLEERRHVAQRREVAEHALAHVRALHLEGNLAPIGERRAMHLRDRCGGERFRIDEGKRGGEALAELFGEDLLYLGEWHRLDVVLQPRERLGIGRRDDVGPSRQELRELDERRPELLHVVGKRLRLGPAGERLAGLLWEKVVQPGAAHPVAAAVLEEEPRYVLVALDMLGAQGEHPGRSANFKPHWAAKQ